MVAPRPVDDVAMKSFNVLPRFIFVMLVVLTLLLVLAVLIGSGVLVLFGHS